MDLVSLCPFPVAAIAWQPHEGAWNLTLCAKATFDLVHGGEARVAARQEPVVGEGYFDGDRRSTPRVPSDFAPYKPRADVLFVGSAYAPSGAAAACVDAALEVGELRKAVRVSGDRPWVRGQGGAVLGPAAPFRDVPMRYERAARQGDNMTGLLPSGAFADQHRAPNIEPIGGAAATPGFAPLPPAWRARRGQLGEAAILWAYRVHARAAFEEIDPVVGPPPAGFDFGFFNCAPRDQQVDLLRPGLAITLENLHPQLARFHTRLPNVRPRLFRLGPQSSRPAEVAMRCDTIWIDGDRLLAVVSFRGMVTVAAPEGSSLGRFVVARESPTERVTLEAVRAALDNTDATATRVLVGAAAASEPKEPVAEATRQAERRRSHPLLPTFDDGDTPDDDGAAAETATAVFPFRKAAEAGADAKRAATTAAARAFRTMPMPVYADPQPEDAPTTHAPAGGSEAPADASPARRATTDPPPALPFVAPKIDPAPLPFQAADPHARQARPDEAPPSKRGGLPFQAPDPAALPFKPAAPREAPRVVGNPDRALPFAPLSGAVIREATAAAEEAARAAVRGPGLFPAPRSSPEAAEPELTGAVQGSVIVDDMSTTTQADSGEIELTHADAEPLAAEASRARQSHPGPTEAAGGGSVRNLDPPKVFPALPGLVTKPAGGLRLGAATGTVNQLGSRSLGDGVDTAPEPRRLDTAPEPRRLDDEPGPPSAGGDHELADEATSMVVPDDDDARAVDASAAAPNTADRPSIVAAPTIAAVSEPAPAAPPGAELVAAPGAEIVAAPPPAPAQPAAVAFAKAAPAEEAQAPLTDPTKPDACPMDRCAAVQAEIALKRAPMLEVLKRHAIDAAVWASIERHWLSKITKETEGGATRLLDAYDAAYVAAIEALRGPITAEDYARIARSVDRGDVGAVLAELGLPRTALTRIERVWARRSAGKPAR